MPRVDPAEYLREWSQSDEAPGWELTAYVQHIVEREHSFRYRKYGQIVTLPMIEETRQNVWLRLLDLRSSGQPLDSHVLMHVVRQEVRRTHRVETQSHQNTVSDDEGLAAASPWEDSVATLESDLDRREIEADKNAALGRLQEKFSTKESPSPSDKPKRSKKKYTRITRDADRRLAKTLVEVTGWSHEETARYLGISITTLRDTLYRHYPLPAGAEERANEGIVLARRRSQGWDWHRLIEAGCAETGKTPVAFRHYLAEVLGVDERTIRRWMNDGHGSVHGLHMALNVRSRGWNR